MESGVNLSVFCYVPDCSGCRNVSDASENDRDRRHERKEGVQQMRSWKGMCIERTWMDGAGVGYICMMTARFSVISSYNRQLTRRTRLIPINRLRPLSTTNDAALALSPFHLLIWNDIPHFCPCSLTRLPAHPYSLSCRPERRHTTTPPTSKSDLV